ncbi:MAG: shikimate dehydrogenase [Candidatus Zixiibacteriota bacterium]|nr:MAG: shikimate dehydrogenase [candidate division Zixibacteria bacterium]
MVSSRKQKLFGIIGGSLGHSLSPLIHNYLFRRFRLDYCYTKFEIEHTQIAKIIDSIRTLNISGANVTFPYKEKLIPYLDKLDKTSQTTGAVNTIKNSHGKLTGYNTDLFGIRATLQNRLNINLKGQTILLLGAGGAARACLVELIRQKPKRIIVANRDFARAESIISRTRISGNNTDIRAIDIHGINNPEYMERLSLLANSTSADPSFLSGVIRKLARNRFHRDMKIFDLNYGRRALPESCRKYPIRYIDGLYMLTAQAAAGFRIWTGIKVEPDDIYKYVSKKIAG